MSYQKRIWLSTFIAGLCFSVMGFACASERTSSSTKAETEAYRVALTSEESSNGAAAEKRFTFSVLNKATQNRTTLKLSNQTTRIDKLQIAGDRLVVFGELSVRAGIVTILNLQGGAIVDYLYGYNPSLSNTGRYLIFNKFYPRFAPAEEMSAVYLIYDLSRTPEKNRLAEADPKDGERVGYPVYPETNFRQKTYQILNDGSLSPHTLVSNNFLWLAEDRQVLFVDRQGDENRLVTIDLSRGLEKAQIRPTPITVRELLTPEAVSDPSIMARAARTLYATELKQISPHKVRVKWASQSYLRSETLDIDLP
ncbi:MAG: hypothetical protein HYR55_07730 [Acidobacteria bacterium]|nr:hypothetical protein [Acidobacteriota bacterium]MBI3656601.1 hypothetical protein [Acidobacteriota bacterium]